MLITWIRLLSWYSGGGDLVVASSFVSIGSRGSAEQFYRTVQSMKWITDYTDSYFENLSLTGLGT